MYEGSDFCPLTCLLNDRNFPEVYRRDDHGIRAILYVLQDQIKSVGLKTDAREILVIVGST